MTKFATNYIYFVFFNKHEQLKIAFNGLTGRNIPTT